MWTTLCTYKGVICSCFIIRSFNNVGVPTTIKSKFQICTHQFPSSNARRFSYPRAQYLHNIIPIDILYKRTSNKYVGFYSIFQNFYEITYQIIFQNDLMKCFCVHGVQKDITNSSKDFFANMFKCFNLLTGKCLITIYYWCVKRFFYLNFIQIYFQQEG